LNEFGFINITVVTYYEVMNGLLYKDARKQLVVYYRSSLFIFAAIKNCSMPKKNALPAEVQAQAEQAVLAFDEAHKMLHQLEFKRGYAYLSRIEKDGELTKIGRLSYLPQTDDWDFTVYKYSSGSYDPQEWGYPGREFLDGTVAGVLQAGLQIYPPTKISKGIV
jgi:hypothetical protein